MSQPNESKSKPNRDHELNSLHTKFRRWSKTIIGLVPIQVGSGTQKIEVDQFKALVAEEDRSHHFVCTLTPDEMIKRIQVTFPGARFLLPEKPTEAQKRFFQYATQHNPRPQPDASTMAPQLPTPAPAPAAQFDFASTPAITTSGRQLPKSLLKTASKLGYDTTAYDELDDEGKVNMELTLLGIERAEKNDELFSEANITQGKEAGIAAKEAEAAAEAGKAATEAAKAAAEAAKAAVEAAKAAAEAAKAAVAFFPI